MEGTPRADFADRCHEPGRTSGPGRDLLRRTAGPRRSRTLGERVLKRGGLTASSVCATMARNMTVPSWRGPSMSSPRYSSSSGTGAFTTRKPGNTRWTGFWPTPRHRIGPIDAVLIWHVYPNLGVDDRNQFDLLRDLPGGIPAFARHGREVSPPRRESILPHHCLGHRHTRGRRIPLGRYFAVAQRNRRRRNQFRHPREHSGALPAGLRRHRPSPRAGTAI